MNNNRLEDLRIYQDMVFLLNYIYMITMKYPKNERLSIVCDIKNSSNSALRNIIYAQESSNIEDRLNYLDKADADLKVLQVLVRISKKQKYINSNNYGAWSRIIAKVNNEINAWKRKCIIIQKGKRNENDKNQV